MWHFIARNFAKPIVIQSGENVTEQNTPQVKRLPTRKEYIKWLNRHMRTNITGLQNRARVYYEQLIKYYED